MMTPQHLTQSLARLSLTQAEAADLLGVAPRTMRRWIEGEELPGPAEQALRAWLKLHDHHLPWRPDAAAIADCDNAQIALSREHAVELAEMLNKVEARGGPRLPFVVDLSRQLATFGPISVSFYRLPNGGFSLAWYRRSDGPINPELDTELIQDAAFCISQAMKRLDPDFGPVVLSYQDGPNKGRAAKRQHERFALLGDAIEHACERRGQPGFHEPFIMAMDPSELLWSVRDLSQECRRRAGIPGSLAALANHTRRNAKYAASGPDATPLSRARSLRRIEAVADKLDGLSRAAEHEHVNHMQFDSLLRLLHAENFFPDNELVSAVAKAMVAK